MIIHIEVICLDSECLKNGLKHYGSTTVGERGQVVLSIEARKKFGIEPGDRLIVLGANAGGFERIILMKSEAMTKMLENFFSFGENLKKISKKSKKK